ncbi:hypothetical protein, unlikely [Trypanosoma brucei gambiense DAL972]|uniref:Uncharacterized protein n=1 Tax=Trypanosoma brucei gambiense (strain MHOM/CI/86/DAL972) TaxID=679716 RepID=C9ZIU8_TRYB9|nr:hypothetical protein, unlikely [Trypanosoma brucei gambiense DAL972]CBH09090.1 hypothetical protein, unlikely [Trypanosoma brucei gambiense DAL972]|eukprot:XP_011771531.1 hypothetical protein, unlikely [Trypanosoma brucei gambiense DAL972]
MMQINLIMTRGGGKTRWIENDIYIYIYIYICRMICVCIGGRELQGEQIIRMHVFFFLSVLWRGEKETNKVLGTRGRGVSSLVSYCFLFFRP